MAWLFLRPQSASRFAPSQALWSSYTHDNRANPAAATLQPFLPFGCLAALAVVLLPLLLVSAYGAWFFYQGFRHNPVLQAAAELVRHDGMAERVLGEDIRITGVAGDSFSFMSGWGSRSDYVVSLQGSTAGGTLGVEATTDHGQVHVESMILTGPDGSRYDLMRHTTTPPDHPSDAPTTSI